MPGKDLVLHQKAREIADRYATAGTEQMCETDIVRLVKEYMRNARGIEQN